MIILGISLQLTGQTSPSFDLRQNVIAGGGTRSTSSSFTLEGTIGQPQAGNQSISTSFLIRDGFWSFETLAPTSANVSVSGRVMRSKTQGIGNAFVTISDPTNNLHFQTFTGTFGYFNFAEVPAGSTYIVTVSHGRYHFSVPSQTITVGDNISGLVFYAETPENGHKEGSRVP